MKKRFSRFILNLVLRWLQNKHVHLIDTSSGGLDYFGEGRVIGGKLNEGPGGSMLGISVLWTSVGTATPDYFHFPLERLRRDKVLGLVIDKA